MRAPNLVLPALASTTLALATLALGGCSDPAPLASDTWPGFDPDQQGQIHFDFASLTLHLQLDSRSTPGEVRMVLPDGSRAVRQLPDLIANNDQFPLGLFEPGVAEVELWLEGETGALERVADRRFTLENKRHHGLEFDQRTHGAEDVAALTLDLGPLDEDLELADGELTHPVVTLHSLDTVLEHRRTHGSDPEGSQLDAELTDAGRLQLHATDLAPGEYVVRVEPGGIECMLALEPGANRLAFDATPTLERLEMQFLLPETSTAPDSMIAHWVAPVDPERSPALVAPASAAYADGKLELLAPAGTIHVLMNIEGVGLRFEAVELAPGGTRGRLDI